MTLERFIAVRYLFGRRQKSVVTVISWISLVGLLVSTTALIVVLSVYNGIGELTKGLFGTFDAELLVEPREGKTFHTSNIDMDFLVQNPYIETVSQVINETAWITYGSNQAIVRLRGVDTLYHKLNGLDTLLHEGTYPFATSTDMDGPHFLLAGGEIYYTLAMRLLSNHPATVLIPRRGTPSVGLSIDQAFSVGYAYPAGYFFIQQDIDRQYVLTDIDMVRQLMNYAPDEVSALALKTRDGVSMKKAKKALTGFLENSATPLKVLDRYDQQPLYFKVFRTERLGIYLILSLIVLISTLSLVASLSLLIINKQRDVFILRSMGMSGKSLRRTFRTEGVLICGVAVVAGLVLGFVVCWLQQQFGLVRMGDGNFVVNAFPVAMRGVDFLLTFLLVMVISIGAVALTVQRAKI